MTTKDKSVWILIVFLLAGLVIGGLIGKLASSVPSLWWLCYEQQFGFWIFRTICFRLKCLKNHIWVSF